MASIKKPSLVNQGAKRKYIVAVIDNVGVNVMLQDDVVKNWDNITHLEIAKKHYDMGRDPQGDGSDEPSTEFAFDRFEIVDYTTRGTVLADANFELELHEITVKKELLTRKLLAAKELTVDSPMELVD